MPKRRLLWQLYPSYLLITLASLVGIGWLGLHWLEQFYLDQVAQNLESQARYVERQVGPELKADDKLLGQAQSLAQATGSRISLVPLSGDSVLDTDPQLGEQEDTLNRGELGGALEGHVQHWHRYNAALQYRLMHVGVPIERGGQVLGAVHASASLAQPDRELARIRLHVVLVGLSIAALVGVLTPLVSRQISRPIQQMRQAAQRFARGELFYKLPLPRAEELSGLAEALNLMAEQLQERISTIERQNNQQQAVLASMVEGVLAVDKHERIISLNKATGQLLGINEAQAQGRRLREVVRNADLQRFVARTLRSDGPVEDDVVLHGEHERVLQARGSALHDVQGGAIGAVVVLHDVTDFRKLEHIRRDFVANVSHELKTPITSIKGFVETLLDGAINDPVDADRFLRIVAKQADRLNAIIDDLLSLSKIEQGEDAHDIVLERGGIKEVLQTAVNSCQAKAEERSISVRLECDDGIVAEYNTQLLEQAVINLLDNAIKYSEPGSEVRLRGVESPHDVVITVVDRGCGIASEHISRIFERFYRVDKARSRKLGGTGLGLAIVKHIVQAHRGRIMVKSTPGLGSTFTICLPRPLIQAAAG